MNVIEFLILFGLFVLLLVMVSIPYLIDNRVHKLNNQILKHKCFEHKLKKDITDLRLVIKDKDIEINEYSERLCVCTSIINRIDKKCHRYLSITYKTKEELIEEIKKIIGDN